MGVARLQHVGSVVFQENRVAIVDVSG
jgi:hypothetical protein